MEGQIIDKRLEYYKDLWKRSYDHLIEFSEIDHESLTDDHCENAIHAMAHIFKNGSCHDVATGMKCFINFIQSKNEVEEMK